MENLVLIDRLEKLIASSKQMEKQIIAIQQEIQFIYNAISDPIEQEIAVKELLPTIIEIAKKSPQSQRYMDVQDYEFQKRSLSEIQAEIVDTSSEIVEKFPNRSDNAEENYFKMVITEIENILKVKIPSRYRVSPSFEDGLDIITQNDVQRAHRRHDEVRRIEKEPYVGRIDYYDLESMDALSYYIGENNFHNENEDLLVIRWSDDRANIFYENRIGQAVEYKGFGKIKLDYIRKIGTKNKELTLHPPQKSESDDAFLINKLTSKRSTLNLDLITATINRTQNRLIRSELNQIMIIQGSAGTGKSIIALYRISYILEKYKNILRENSIAFFGPNNLFLKHISSALKGLGNEKITKTQINSYLQKYLKIESLTKDLNSKYHDIKGSIEYKNYIQFYTEFLLSNIKPWLTPFSLKVGKYELTIEGIDIGLEYQRTLVANYSDRKNMLLNALLKKIQDSLSVLTSIDKKILPSSRIYVSTLVEKYYKNLVEDNNEKKIDYTLGLNNFDKILSLKTIEEIKNTLIVIKKENRRASNEFLPSAMSNIAKELERKTSTIIKKDLISYFSSLSPTITEEIDSNYYRWVLELYEDDINNLLEYEIHQNIKEAYTIEINSKGNNYIKKIEDVISEVRIEIEKDLVRTHMGKIIRRKKDLIKDIVEKTKIYLTELFKEEVEKLFVKQLNKISQEVYYASFNYKRSKEPEQLNKFTFNQPVVNEELISRFLENILYSSPEKVYSDILNDSLHLQQNNWRRSEFPNNTNLTTIDLPPLLLISKMMQGTGYRAPLQYAVVDEAQDLYPFTVWAIRNLLSSDGLIMFGDLGQNLNEDNPINSWEEYAPILGLVNYYNLDTNYRSTKEIFNYSNKIIEPFARGKYDLPIKCYLNGEKVREYIKGTFNYSEVLNQEILNGLVKSKAYETIAILCKDEVEVNKLIKYKHLNVFLKKKNLQMSYKRANEVDSNSNRLLIMTVKEAKGLQFDYVIIANHNAYSNSDYDTKLLYVAVSRALHELVVLNKGSQ